MPPGTDQFILRDHNHPGLKDDIGQVFSGQGTLLWKSHTFEWQSSYIQNRLGKNGSNLETGGIWKSYI